MARPGKKGGLRYIEEHLGPDGKLRRYFRIGKGTRTPMPPTAGDPNDDPAFMAAYNALRGEATGIAIPKDRLPKTRGARPVIVRASADSFGAALDRYYRHSSFTELAAMTQENHRRDLNRFARRFGAAPMAGLDHEAIQEAIRPLEPFPQRHLVYALRKFVTWARATGELDARTQDPTLGLALHPAPKIRGHQPWTDKQRAQFERRWPIGTRERLGYEIMHRLGLRAFDARRLGPDHVSNGWLRFQPHKTRSSSKVWLDQPMDPELMRIIAATKVTGARTYLVNSHGKPFPRETFRRFMRDAYTAARLPADCRNHGLRKSMMIDLVEAEAGVHEIMALSGHVTMKEIENYTRDYDRRKAAVRAQEKRQRRSLGNS